MFLFRKESTSYQALAAAFLSAAAFPPEKKPRRGIPALATPAAEATEEQRQQEQHEHRGQRRQG